MHRSINTTSWVNFYCLCAYGFRADHFVSDIFLLLVSSFVSSQSEMTYDFNLLKLFHTLADYHMRSLGDYLKCIWKRIYSTLINGLFWMWSVGLVSLNWVWVQYFFTDFSIWLISPLLKVRCWSLLWLYYSICFLSDLLMLTSHM